MYKVLFLVAGFFIISCHPARAASLYWEKPQYISTQTEASIPLLIDTEGQTINAIEGTLNLSTDTPVTINIDNSVINFWVNETGPVQDQTVIKFGGVVLNPGFSGVGEVLRITPPTGRNQPLTVSIVSQTITEHDGTGKEINHVEVDTSHFRQTTLTPPLGIDQLPTVSQYNGVVGLLNPLHITGTGPAGSKIIVNIYDHNQLVVRKLTVVDQQGQWTLDTRLYRKVLHKSGKFTIGIVGQDNAETTLSDNYIFATHVFLQSSFIPFITYFELAILLSIVATSLILWLPKIRATIQTRITANSQHEKMGRSDSLGHVHVHNRY